MYIKYILEVKHRNPKLIQDLDMLHLQAGHVPELCTLDLDSKVLCQTNLAEQDGRCYILKKKC